MAQKNIKRTISVTVPWILVEEFDNFLEIGESRSSAITKLMREAVIDAGGIGDEDE